MNNHRERVLLIGADGADPKILSRLMSQGKLPTFSRLCKRGAWGALETTLPPVSPVAWMTCLTGVSPARHGIHDFITKAPGSYLPTIGLFHVGAGADGIPVYNSRRTAPMLGELLSAAGRTAYVLKVPGTFPPVSIRGGMLAGFGMPDLLGTFGVSAWYTTDVPGKQASTVEGKEWVSPLEPAGDNTWYGKVSGPANTVQRFLLHRSGGQITLSLEADPSHSVAVLSMGMWSGWVRLAFDLPGRGHVGGMCRFKLVSLGRNIELYRTAIQCTPDDSLFPLAEPPGFAERLQGLVGPFATLGMPSDMDGVRRGVVDLDTFLQGAYADWDQQIEMTLALMNDPSWDLLISHLFAVDNVQHLFWHCQDRHHPEFRSPLADRFGEELERAYRWLDSQLERLLARVDGRTTVIVVSDHGGVPVYRLVYPNAWLRAQGYLVPRETGDRGVVARLDWDRTRAAMFGTGGIWINVQGREPRGNVSPGAPYEALRSEIARALSTWRDPENGHPVVKHVLHGEQVFGPDARNRGPDLVIVLHTGYGLGRGEGLGRVMLDTPLIVANHSPWSGGHEGPYLPSDVPGICVLAGPRVSGYTCIDGATLADIAPTVLDLLALDDVPGMTGRSLLKRDSSF